MSINLKCAACGHEIPFKDEDINSEEICPGCEVLVRRREVGDQMAIPVSMALPDEFETADLGRVPKNSQELIHRYSKNTPLRIVKTGDPIGDSNLVLAKAIERLAAAIEEKGGHIDGLGEELSELAQSDHSTQHEAHTNGHEVPVLNGNHGKSTHSDENGRAQPIGSPVLVRREAAAEAHRFQRGTQAATDIKGPKQSGASRWIEEHPYLMMSMGLILLVALVVMVTILMNDSLTDSDEPNLVTAAMIGEGQVQDTSLEHAEREARGFLNAVALKPARPYIFRANMIVPKLEKFYKPLPDPANYELELTGRQKNGNKSVYYYQVTSGGQIQPLVVLQENESFKVFWEFGACVGDLSWESFVNDEPRSPVLMRAFLKPESVYDSLHSKKEWTSWRAENWDGTEFAQVFSKIGSPGDRRLKSALEEHSVNRNNSNWVMAQVRLQHLGTGVDAIAGAFESAEIVEVPLGSWLPEEFVVGNTFYSEKDQHKGNIKEIPGLRKKPSGFK